MEGQETVGQRPVVAPVPAETMFGLLEWLAKVSVPLGAMLLAVAALYWVEFIKLYALPVNFASSGPLTGLPALAAVIAALVGLMALSALMPMVALVYPLDSEGHTLIHTHQMANGGSTGAQWGGSLGKRWITITIALTVLWPLVIAALSLLPGIEKFLWVFFGVAIVISYGFILPIYRQATAKNWPPSDVTMIFISAVGVQLMVTFWVVYVAVKTLSSTQVFTMITAFFICLSICGAISAGQFIAAKRYVQGLSAQTPKWVVPAALVIMALPLAYPPLGGAIASYPFRVSPAGGGSCVILAAKDFSEKTAWADIADKKHPGHTLPLDFAVRLDDAYYIKLTEDPATHILPAAMVTKVEGCPKPTPKPTAKTSTAVSTSSAHKDEHMALAAILISLGSLLAAIFSVYFTVRLWRKSNRPLVTARIAAHSGGNTGISLDILVENTGTRPALDVRLCAKKEDIRAAMRVRDDAPELQRDANRIFFSDVSIPVLPNGRTMSNAFGGLGDGGGDWHAGARIPIKVIYSGMDGTRYNEQGVLLLHDDSGFAQTSWEGPAGRDISHHHVTVTKHATT